MAAVRAQVKYIYHSIFDLTQCMILCDVCRPANKEELFNLRHASARNVVERIFGVLKQRFRILLLSPEYSMAIQARIPSALCAIHNFIRLHDSNEGPLPGFEGTPGGSATVPGQGAADEEAAGIIEEGVGAMRDRIAQAMWDDYQNILYEGNYGSNEMGSDSEGDVEMEASDIDED
jgi:hypothetical protein